jgi:hypothetical protein
LGANNPNGVYQESSYIGTEVLNVLGTYCFQIGEEGDGRYGAGGATPSNDDNKGNSGNIGTYPNLIKLAKKVSLDAIGKEILEDEIAMLKREYCGYKYMFGKIEGLFQLSNINYTPSTSFPGSCNSSTKTYSVQSNNLITSSFTEEVIHFYQDCSYPGGIKQYSTAGKPNIKFEAKLLQDLNCIQKGYACPYYGIGSENGRLWLMNIRIGLQN